MKSSSAALHRLSLMVAGSGFDFLIFRISWRDGGPMGDPMQPGVSVGRILLIDDDDRFRGLVRLMLTTAGYDVQEAAGGKVGVAHYRALRSDVVITDILMPDGEGLETIEALKRLHPGVKIIAMSSGEKASSAISTRPLHSGPGESLKKPFSREELLSAVTDTFAA